MRRREKNRYANKIIIYYFYLYKGWGKLWAEPLNDTSYPTDLMEALIEIKSHQKCKEKYKGLVTKNMLCAGMFDTTYTDTCYRDSGGPLMCENNDGSW